jgi:transcriptional regulator with XRE-family HTH domain
MSNTQKVPVLRTFGKNLSRLRVEHGMTQLQLAVEADISRYHLQRLESGQSQPTLPVVLRLKKALRCSWDELMEGLEG